jgi:hypothetical protein
VLSKPLRLAFRVNTRKPSRFLSSRNPLAKLDLLSRNKGGYRFSSPDSGAAGTEAAAALADESGAVAAGFGAIGAAVATGAEGLLISGLTISMLPLK